MGPVPNFWKQIYQKKKKKKKKQHAVADPGFPVGGTWTSNVGAFQKNVCENERIGSHRGACTQHAP